MTVSDSPVRQPGLLATPAGRFRVAAIAEAVTWAALLIGMFFKYGPAGNEIGVKIFGPIHGGVFIIYVIVTLLSIRPLRWSPIVAIVALAASIPPFFTIIFEQWAARTGRLPR